MKKLTQEEADKLRTKPPGRISPVRLAISELEPGEHLLVEHKDWKVKKHTPRLLCRRIERKSSARFEVKHVISNGGGWLVTRIK